MKSVVLSMLLLAPVAHAAGATRLTAGAASMVMLDGSSNVADWRCRGTSIDATMLVATTPDHLNDVIDRVEDGNIGVWMARPSAGSFPTPEFRLRIPVTTFRCGNRVMESDMRRALKADRHAFVEFVFRELKGGIHHDIDSGRYRAELVGELTLAGVTRTIVLDLSAERISRTRFRFRSELPLRMTQFGVTPPSALFGAIKARDNLTVRFDLMLEVQS